MLAHGIETATPGLIILLAASLVIAGLVTAPVVAGMLVGQKVRDAIPADAFKKLIVLVVLLSGAQLVWKGVFG